MDKKIVRLLLRVSSNQQLEADGDLSIQRQLVKEFVERHEDWLLDEKEYFEGSNSGYKNAVSKRDTLQEALNDAEKVLTTKEGLTAVTVVNDLYLHNGVVYEYYNPDYKQYILFSHIKKLLY